MSEKQCPLCDEWLPATPEFFWRDKTYVDGLTVQGCKGCLKEKYHNDPEYRASRLASCARYRRTTAGRVRAYANAKAWREKNPERYHAQTRAASKAWRENNREHKREYHREYYRKPEVRESRQTRRKEWRENNREKYLESQREYRREYRQRPEVREYNRIRARECRLKKRIQAQSQQAG